MLLWLNVGSSSAGADGPKVAKRLGDFLESLDHAPAEGLVARMLPPADPQVFEGTGRGPEDEAGEEGVDEAADEGLVWGVVFGDVVFEEEDDVSKDVDEADDAVEG